MKYTDSQIKRESIHFGPDYSDRLTAFLDGEKIEFSSQCIDTSLYTIPYYKTYLLPSKRVVKVIDNVICAILELYGSVKDYERSKAIYWAKFAESNDKN